MTLTAMPKYDTYKDSGVTWVGDIPDHWRIYRFRNMFSFSKGLNITKDNLQDDGIPCVNYGEVHSKFGFEIDPNKHKLKYVSESYLKNEKSLLSKGDFVFADTSEDLSGSGNFTQLISDVVTFAGYHTVVARPICNQNNRFLAYLFDSISYRNQIRSAVKGVKVFSITKSILKDTWVWLPNGLEQAAIANFLDNKTAQIDEAIAIKEQQVELLNERKQILIQQAVTNGFNPSAPLKDSGIEWIGKIPEHWECKKVKHLFRLTMEQSEKNNNHELLSVYSDIGVKPRKELEERGNKASTTDGYWIVKKGDVVVNKLLAWMGAIGLSEYDGVTSPAYDILRPKKRLNGHFYHYLFRSKFCSTELKRHSRGIMDMRLRLYFDKFGVIEVPYPPKEEQDKIIEKLNELLSDVNNGINVINKQIKKYQEYKSTLINSAVTGKIKVV